MPTPVHGEEPLQLSLHCLLETGAKVRMIELLTEPSP
jgi:hypothetical protein